MWPICVAIGENSISKMSDLALRSESQADLIEFRLDYLEVIDFVELEKLLEKITNMWEEESSHNKENSK